ncbi:MAG: hypothetical protein ACD_16C00059G0023 [uncultured bacterium]|nr:MAG: hypothetical protein ACD_16C00059G0023 [uncultured bacterium]
MDKKILLTLKAVTAMILLLTPGTVSASSNSETITGTDCNPKPCPDSNDWEKSCPALQCSERQSYFCGRYKECLENDSKAYCSGWMGCCGSIEC